MILERAHTPISNDLFLNDFIGEDFLEEIISIDSQVKNLKGIEKVQLRLKEEFERLSFKTEMISNPLIESAPLLIAKRVTHPLNKTVTFIAHSDVVASLKKTPFKKCEHFIHGAGVADDKGGVTLCLKALDLFFQSNQKYHLNFNVVISPNEETGSTGFHTIFSRMGKESDYILGLEPALQDGSIINKRSGNRWYHLCATGIAAHSGRFGNDYINAAHHLSLIISKIHSLNDEENQRRMNVGSFHGGNGGFNTICDRAFAKIDARFSSFECREILHKAFEDIIQKTTVSCPYSQKLGQLIYTIEDDCPPMSESQSIEETQILLNAIEKYEYHRPSLNHAGGAADINYFAHPNKFLLDGLGPIGGKLHTTEEYIDRKSLWSRTQALSDFLVSLNEKSKQERRSHDDFNN
ncbi:M20/M25/M40 family metallo-hydrolase [Halobacteriovorax sp. GB3]|uniref:M20/M25/M40 family metallo-hydrolase n=1 Tax=Halobacteriovorax sp. GB3 TaxID=2719615 RepID=UPI00235E7D12|nr:M20/M25/M40 family metallo-hydrolase [Halobacteriovorax sp. GB3]MDD0851727.1 M20/M25/M40 family metallo-hydrolase [Halobacteriovorax sp. GB3]